MRAPALMLTLVGMCLLPMAVSAEESLAQDGRMALVTDRQGLVLVRPAGRQRWSTLSARAALYPGDRVRTETLGAHALDLRLKAGGRLTLGPGSLLELGMDGAFDLRAGEAEVLGSAASPVAVRGAGGFAGAATGPLWLRVKDGRAEALPEPPRWLTGYRKGLSDEWMGSLIASVDGAPVALHVGSHKVDVEILDQVARTTIEQTFVNTTNTRLEGTFRFPLPAEASISGFGMWIGGEYVEADVVERERARQIYEDILRRKKDPGLLEWAGGNVFQARVFPIEPHEEKRIRLRYTEVLPLEGSTWRYRYALRSELLRLHPLRELSVTVRVASTAPLAEVTCPTHPDAGVTRPDPTTALVELSRRDVSPDRDLEVAGRLAASAGLTVVTHRRGADGWFMLLLQPPAAAAAGWERDLVPEGEPLDLIVAVDTSGSVDPAARAAQEAFLTALLGLLGPEDRVRLAAFDVETRFLSEAARPVDADLLDEVRGFLAARPPRGWTDLEGALGALNAAARPGTQVVVLSDGIGTSGDPDPVALAQRIRASAAASRGTFHAVAPSSTYERPVLEALASLGGGSVRHLKDDPAGEAQRLLTEAALPLIKDARVEVQGLATARVYPETLPNLPLGRQHTVLGRFLPTGAAAAGTVVVTGTLEGKPVRYSAPLAVPADGAGNSFLPRLWARRHLDALLAQGASAQVKEEIVRFSTEYGILTPTTSLLVLESDEDRETYGVTRRVHARDGEAEFAAARDKVALEAARQAARQARTWRQHLRRQMLTGIAGLGREAPIPVPTVAWAEWTLWSEASPRPGQLGGSEGWGSAVTYGGRTQGGFEGPSSGPRGGAREYEYAKSERLTEGKALDEASAPPPPMAAAPRPSSAPMSKGEEPEEMDAGAAPGAPGDDDLFSDQDAIEEEVAEKEVLRKSAYSDTRRRAGRPMADAPDSPFERLPLPRPEPDVSALGFPGAEAARTQDPESPEPALADAQAQALLLRALDGPADDTLLLEVNATRETLHGPSQEVRFASQRRVLRAPERWFLRSEDPGDEPRELSLSDGLRTTLWAGTRLARTWRGGPKKGWRLSALRRALGYPGLADLAGLRVTVLPPVQDRPRLAVGGTPGHPAEVWTLDAGSGAVLERTGQNAYGEPEGRVAFEDRVLLAGVPWPTRIEVFDDHGRLVRRTRIQLASLSADDFQARFSAALDGRGDVLTLGPDLPDVAAARAALSRASAGLTERLVLAADRLSVGRYDEMWVHAQAALGLAAGRPGAEWIRAGLLQRSRRLPDLAEHLTGVLTPLAAARSDAGWPLAHRVWLTARRVLGPAEELALLLRLEPAWAAPGAPAPARRAYDEARIEALTRAGRTVEAGELRAALARRAPTDAGLQVEYAAHLARTQAREAAINWLTQTLASGAPFSEAERDSLEEYLTDRLAEAGRWDALEARLSAWAEARPDAVEAHLRGLSLRYARGREAEADRWAEQVLPLADAQDPAQRRASEARRQAAVAVLLGRAWGYRTRDLPTRWHAPLATLAQHLLAGDDPGRDLGVALLRDARLAGTDPGRLAREQAREALTAPDAVERLPYGGLLALLALVPTGPGALDAETAERLLAGLERRFAGADVTPAERLALTQAALRLAQGRDLPLRTLDVLRRARAAAAGRERLSATERLLGALYGSAYAAEREEEMLALLEDLVGEDPGQPARSLGRRGLLLRRVVSWAVAGRAEALQGTPQERAARSRTEARAAERESRRAARVALADRLQAFLTRASPGGVPDAADPAVWTVLERAALLSEAGVGLEQVVAAAEPLLPPVARVPATERFLPTRQVERAVQARALALLAHAATRRQTPPALADRVVALLKAREACEEHDLRFEVARLLIALDRVDALRERLSAWAAESDASPRFVRMRAHLEAELGHLEAACAALEPLSAVEGALTPGDLEALALWLRALGEDRRRQAALRARLEVEPEWTLRSRLQTETQRVSRRPGGPGMDLDPEVLPAVGVLLKKAAYPANHLWVVMNLYRSTKDHRVLTGLVEGVPGHTAEGAYAFLERLGTDLAQVHEEATLDALRAAVAERLTGPTEPEDRRALRFLEALVEARASEVLLKDPGPAARAAAALSAALEGVKADVLRPLVAALSTLRLSPARDLAEERVRGLERLLAAADVANGDRLVVARALAQALAAAEQPDAALDRLAAAMDEAHATADPRALEEWTEALEQRVRLLADLGRFAAAEALLVRARADLLLPPGVRRGLLPRTLRLYAQGLRKRGTFALGAGEALARASWRLTEQAWSEAPNLAAELHAIHVDLFAAAKAGSALTTVGEERVRFARERLPELLTGLAPAIGEATEREAQALADLAGPRDALRFLLARAQAEPPFHLRVSADVWSQNRYRMAEWRLKAEPLAELDAPLFLFVRQRLLERLLREDPSAEAFWSAGNRFFWASKAAEFQATILAAAEQAPASPTRQRVCAQALATLGREADAADLLLTALARGVSDRPGRERLLSWLLAQKRHEQALAVVDGLLKETPDVLGLHLNRVEALAGLGRLDEARQTLTATAARFGSETTSAGARTLGTIGGVAGSAKLHAEAVDLLGRALKARRATEGRDDPIDAGWRASLAVSLAALGRLDEAVTAAASALVGSGAARGRAGPVLSKDTLLVRVLREAPDLAAFVARHEQRVAATGEDIPLVRRALAFVYRQHLSLPAEAVKHLEVLRALAPGDPQTLRELTDAYDSLGEGDRALEALAQRLVLEPGDVAGWRDLGARFAKRGQSLEAERAYTGAIEARPLEPDGQRLLAEVRSDQGRPADAAARWALVTRLRPLEPEARVAEARAWIRAGAPDKARAPLLEVLGGTWEARFEKVKEEAAALLATLK